MEFLRPANWEEALAVRAARPGALPIAGGTDVMVEVNAGRCRADALLDLSRVHALRAWSTGRDGGQETVRLGACVPYAVLAERLRTPLPGLAMAAGAVGSPQVRSRGSIGGSLGTASPAGDAHPALLAAGAVVEAASVRGTRLIPAAEFYAGPGRTALAADELIRAVRVPAARGPQLFAKCAARNAVAVAACSFALALHPGDRTVRTGIGGAGPVPLRARAAEEHLAGVLTAEGLWDAGRGRPIPPAAARGFAELAAAACRPADDVRGTARYRAHAVGVLAGRTLAWAVEALTAPATQVEGGPPCA